MSESDAVTPVVLRAPEGARQMEIEWADGHHTLLPHRLLRGFCPCAECQGHQGPIRFRHGGDLELRDLEPVGNYAVRLVWGDGHQNGLYAFAYLRDLCACAACAAAVSGPLEERTFTR